MSTDERSAKCYKNHAIYSPETGPVTQQTGSAAMLERAGGILGNRIGNA